MSPPLPQYLHPRSVSIVHGVSGLRGVVTGDHAMLVARLPSEEIGVMMIRLGNKLSEPALGNF